MAETLANLSPPTVPPTVATGLTDRWPDPIPEIGNRIVALDANTARELADYLELELGENELSNRLSSGRGWA